MIHRSHASNLLTRETRPDYAGDETCPMVYDEAAPASIRERCRHDENRPPPPQAALPCALSWIHLTPGFFGYWC